MKRMAQPWNGGHSWPVYPNVVKIVRPYLVTAITFKHYIHETSVCLHFMQAPTA